MSKCLQIGSCVFSYPEQGTNPGWGEDATCWAIAVTNQLNTISQPNDITLRSVIICNNINSCNSFPCGKTLGIGATKVRFSSTLVRSFCLDYTATRLGTVCNSCTPTYESGLISGIYDGTNWDFTHDFLGCAGLDFNIDSSGQIYYFTDSQKGQGTIKLKATTIAQ